MQQKKKAVVAEKKAAATQKRGTGKSIAGTKQPTSSSTRPVKQARSKAALIDPDAPSSSMSMVWQCPVCFEYYNKEDEEDWVMCGCSRWTRESCIMDVVFDSTGKELFCPYCSV